MSVVVSTEKTLLVIRSPGGRPTEDTFVVVTERVVGGEVQETVVPVQRVDGSGVEVGPRQEAGTFVKDIVVTATAEVSFVRTELRLGGGGGGGSRRGPWGRRAGWGRSDVTHVQDTDVAVDAELTGLTVDAVDEGRGQEARQAQVEGEEREVRVHVVADAVAGRHAAAEVEGAARAGNVVVALGSGTGLTRQVQTARWVRLEVPSLSSPHGLGS